jgi:hypothetical protein
MIDTVCEHRSNEVGNWSGCDHDLTSDQIERRYKWHPRTVVATRIGAKSLVQMSCAKPASAMSAQRAFRVHSESPLRLIFLNWRRNRVAQSQYSRVHGGGLSQRIALERFHVKAPMALPSYSNDGGFEWDQPVGRHVLVLAHSINAPCQ